MPCQSLYTGVPYLKCCGGTLAVEPLVIGVVYRIWSDRFLTSTATLLAFLNARYQEFVGESIDGYELLQPPHTYVKQWDLRDGSHTEGYDLIGPGNQLTRDACGRGGAGWRAVVAESVYVTPGFGSPETWEYRDFYKLRIINGPNPQPCFSRRVGASCAETFRVTYPHEAFTSFDAGITSVTQHSSFSWALECWNGSTTVAPDCGPNPITCNQAP